jgi:lipopolysaccharide/colanic/teichoic acid biosynthesis glycosyltransferase
MTQNPESAPIDTTFTEYTCPDPSLDKAILLCALTDQDKPHGKEWWSSKSKTEFERTLIICSIPLASVAVLFSAVGVVLFEGFPIQFIHDRYHPKYGGIQHNKLRTMIKGADKLEVQIPREVRANQVNDYRITRLGKFLRNLHLDELPQLFNALNNQHLALIGPRGLPKPDYDFFLLNQGNDTPSFGKHIEVLQQGLMYGVTGLSQVCDGRYVHPEVVCQMDLLYAKYASKRLDSIIYFITIPILGSLVYSVLRFYDRATKLLYDTRISPI